MPIMLSDDAKKKLMTFMVNRSMERKPEEESEKSNGDDDGSENISGSLFAAEKMMEAIKSGDAKSFDMGLSEWFDMRPADSSEAYTDGDDSNE